MKTIIAIAFLIFSYVLGFAQDSLVFKGHYSGKNLYVLNPSCGKDTIFTVSKVLVNREPTKDEIKSNSFEIDFSLLDLNNDENVEIKIFYKSGCKPKIINPEVLQSLSTFSFMNTKADKAGKITWNVKGEVFSAFTVEQFRWNKWVTVAEIENTDTVKKNNYAYDSKPHFGLNTFRISHTDEKGNIVYSKQIKFKIPTIKEVFISALKVTDVITFSSETAYEIFDDKGKFIMDGTGTQVNISDLSKGKYSVNYDNKTEIISKK
ncbi:MAG TPA: hypothetical protein PKK00_00605 [Bacteroidales bacterium]|nr:hypothetical protein [Bacteroidales bacterium]HPS15992.1 hypothetical protein [Bacteroidales bacterium]